MELAESSQTLFEVVIEVDSDNNETYYKINTAYPCRRQYHDYFLYVICTMNLSNCFYNSKYYNDFLYL